MEQRYIRNIPAISENDQTLLADKKVLVLGCGGLGGYIIECLARLGVGHLTVVDGDCFEESNLNRQLYSSPDLIGYSKALAAADRVHSIAPFTQIVPVKAFFDETNADELIQNQDLVIDALDNISARFLMEDICEKHNITFVHGAILGWIIQVTVGRPGSRILHKLYKTTSADLKKDSVQKTSLPMTPAACAALEVAEALKILVGQESTLSNTLLMLNLQTMEQHVIPFA